MKDQKVHLDLIATLIEKYNLNKDKNTQRKQKVWEQININGGTVPLLLLSRKNGGTVPLLLLASMAEQFHLCF